jgi:hypothetical protein
MTLSSFQTRSDSVLALSPVSYVELLHDTVAFGAMNPGRVPPRDTYTLPSTGTNSCSSQRWTRRHCLYKMLPKLALRLDHIRPHPWPQHFRHHHAPVALLVILQSGDNGTSKRNFSAVQSVDEFGSLEPVFPLVPNAKP